MTNKSVALDDLYQSYGFKIHPASKECVRCYVYDGGYFKNADVIGESDNQDFRRLSSELKTSGYGVNTYIGYEIDKYRKHLFRGFFALENAKKRATREYHAFADKQGRLLGSTYTYVDPPFDSSEDGNTNATVASSVLGRIKSRGPQLIVLEAAAGYGKTCTAFELLKLFNDSFPDRLPMLIELSRNRSAAIFKYVLQDEKDRHFSQISYDLLCQEIQSGRIIPIIDGFDELLRSSSDENADDYERTEPMLVTIGELLTNSAKIVLTTRRTAIFAGDDFHNWIDEHVSEFDFARFSIYKPRVEDWLSEERLRALKQNSIPIESIENPVILAFLRSLDNSSFSKTAQSGSNIINRYFNSLLDRERDRQDLYLSADDQLDVYKRVALDMAREGFTAEAREYTRIRIEDAFGLKLHKTLKLYPPSSNVSFDTLVDKLLSHALLDRIGEGEKAQIAFVNEFVLGFLSAQSVIENHAGEQIYSDAFVEYMSFAFKALSREKRDSLYELLRRSIEQLPASAAINAEIYLLSSAKSQFSGQQIMNEQYSGEFYSSHFTFRNGLFMSCKFIDCQINAKHFPGTVFVNCTFYDCEIRGFDSELETFVGCTFSPERALRGSRPRSRKSSGDNTLEREVLEQFWPKGRPHAVIKRTSTTLLKGFSPDVTRSIVQAIQDLKHRNVLFEEGDMYCINLKEMNTIRSILGRD